LHNQREPAAFIVGEKLRFPTRKGCRSQVERGDRTRSGRHENNVRARHGLTLRIHDHACDLHTAGIENNLYRIGVPIHHKS
jgi:hypothetical protein